MKLTDIFTAADDELEDELVQSAIIKLKKDKLRKRVYKIVTICVLVAVLLISALFYGRAQAKKKAEDEIAELKATIEQRETEIQELKEAPIVVNRVAPEINLDIIKSEISNIAELATVQYLFTAVEVFRDSQQIKDWNIPFTEKSFIVKWDGIIKAGVKLDNISITVSDSQSKIVVGIPSAEILSYEVDDDSIEIVEEKDNIFNNISITDKIDSDAKIEEEMKAHAVENGILKQARENAEEIITRLLTANASIGTDYTIEFITIAE